MKRSIAWDHFTKILTPPNQDWRREGAICGYCESIFGGYGKLTENSVGFLEKHILKNCSAISPEVREEIKREHNEFHASISSSKKDDRPKVPRPVVSN